MLARSQTSVDAVKIIGSYIRNVYLFWSLNCTIPLVNPSCQVLTTIWKQHQQQLGSNLSHTEKTSRPPTPRVIRLEDNWSPLCHVSPRSCTLSPLRMMCMCNMPISMREFESAGVFRGGQGGSTCLSLTPFI